MDIHAISALFGIPVAEYTQIATGHINRTFLVTSHTGERYILQSLNREVFLSPENVMWNISAIETAFKGEKSVAVPRFMHCSGRNYAEYCGEIWRMYPYVPDNECQDKAYLAGFSHGRFIKVLSGGELRLKTAIDGFHSYSSYMEKLRAVSHAAEHTEKLEALGNRLSDVFSDVPKRNIHGDAKADNIIIGAPCTVIDLDTAMYSYAAIDYGDMIRSADTDNYEKLTEGFAEGLDGLLTNKEIQSLYYGVLWVTGELAVRYLTDVYAENRYFSGKTREQCRERAGSLMQQLGRFKAMKGQFTEMIRKHF